MSEPRDEELSRVYREAEAPEPPQRIDAAILAASRRAAGTRPRPVRAGLVRRLSAPMALAATVLLTFTVTLMVFQDLPEPDSAQVAVRPETADARSEKLAQAQPGAVRDAPSSPQRWETFDTLSKRQRPKGSQEVQEPRRSRESEPMRADRATQAAPAAPAPSASPRQEPALKLQSTGVVGAVSGRSASGEAKERSPEKWLEDIRALKARGKTPEVERELAEFKKRYPDYRLPEDLR